MNDQPSREISGLIPVYKPTGMTSKDVSRVILRKCPKIKLGHVGTLDPDADGVLPVLVGRATKLQDYLLNMPKAYQCELTLGRATDTMDATGTVTESAPWEHLGPNDIRAVIPKFIGTITQVPPIFSAVKFRGKPLYKLAHQGVAECEVPLASLARQVQIISITIDDCTLPNVLLTVHCTKGTYIRTLAHELSKALGTVGHVSKLTRILSSGWSLSQCIPLDQLRADATDLATMVVDIHEISIGLPTWITNDMVVRQKLIDGQRVIVTSDQMLSDAMPIGSEVLAKFCDGRSFGILNIVPLEGGHFKLHMKRGL